MKKESVNSESDFELNETRDSADKYPEFGNNTRTAPSHSNTGHMKDIASSPSGMISHLVNLTDLPDAYPSFSLSGLSEGREQLSRETDLAYQESLKSDKLKTVTRKNENHKSINFDTDVEVIEKSNINNNKEATRLRTARCKRSKSVFAEPNTSEEKFMVSVKHPNLGILR